jgi:16S rRNA (cytosine967-C5)-methyltransferase
MMGREHDTRVPLWRQIQLTARVIQRVRQGVSGTVALELIDQDLRPGVQALAFAVWRNLGRAEAIRTVITKRLPPEDIDSILCVALALVWRGDSLFYDEFTLVNQAVEAAKRTPEVKLQANFLNACLRRFLRERTQLVERTNCDPVAYWNHPRWWIERVKKEHPQAWKEILLSANSHPPMTLRVNQRKMTSFEYSEALRHANIPFSVGSQQEVYLDVAKPVRLIPGFQEGCVSVQDAAAQLAAPLLLDGFATTNGLRVLDACAAPGGKTGHLLERADCHVTALDIDDERAKRIAGNLARLGLHAEVSVGDASRPQDWWDGRLFDAVLLDAPCTASGIVRRHPDIRWLRRESDVGSLATLQQKLMQVLWPMLRPGGRLLYCTCSIFRAEGAEQVETFLAHNTDALLLDSPGHLLGRSTPKSEMVLDNPKCDYDGFYYALLQRH